MEENKRHPLSSVESFTKWLEETFGCINCKHIEQGDKPIHEKRCTNPIAIAPSKAYPTGVETDKSWLRQDDIERELRGGLPFGRRDINTYFMCDYFENETDEKERIQKDANGS